MGYSTSPKTIQANQDLLAPLIAAETQAEVVLPFTELSAPRKAQKIRECFHVAKLHRDQFVRLAYLADTREVLVVGASVVVRAKPGVTVNGYTPASATRGSGKLLLSAKTSAEIIQAYLDNPDIHTLVVKYAELPSIDSTEVDHWVAANSWSIIRAGRQLTIHFSSDATS